MLVTDHSFKYKGLEEQKQKALTWLHARYKQLCCHGNLTTISLQTVSTNAKVSKFSFIGNNLYYLFQFGM